MISILNSLLYALIATRGNSRGGGEGGCTCGVPDCVRDGDYRTNCCGIHLCAKHVAEFEECCRRDGRCPIRTCRRRV